MINEYKGSYTRRQELFCTEAEIATYANIVLYENEKIYVKMNSGVIRMKLGDGVTILRDLPYTKVFDGNLETVEKMLTDVQKDRVNLRRHVRCVGMSIWWYDGRELASSGYRGGVIARGYQTLIKERYYTNGLTSYAYSGCSLGGTGTGDSSCIMNYAYQWSGTKGDIWLLDTITNDFKRNIPIGTFWDNFAAQTGVTTYYGALKEFEKKVRALSGKNAVIIVSNACRRNSDGYTSTSVNAVGHTLLDYEKALLNVASWNDWLFVDQYRCALTDEAVEFATIDGLHLNNFGYTLAIRPWFECLDTLVEKTGEPVSVDMNVGKYIDGDSNHVTYGMVLDTVSSDWQTSDYIPVTLGEKYRYIGNTEVEGGNLVSCVFGYDSNYASIANIVEQGNYSNGLSFSIPDNVSYIAVCGYVGSGNTLSVYKI